MPGKIHFENITAEMPIIGFTGALGSGCSFFAHGLADHHGYAYCSLSQPIHEACRQAGLPETSESLQDIGNNLRHSHGLDYLVGATLKQLDQQIGRQNSRPIGLVVDGIRNTAEVTALRAWTHFHLISVQADQSVRMKRVITDGNRCKDEDEFLAADARDAEEQKTHGQQVRRCNYLADIIVLNDEEISRDAQIHRQQYVSRKVHSPYVVLIEHLAKGHAPREIRARADEALMTIAYVESKRSSCLKRKVGAVIATKDGHFLSAGHNDVPEASKPCIEDSRYGWCARDVIQEQFAQRLVYCPGCGTAIALDTSCPTCQTRLRQFAKRCPTCKNDLETEYTCPKCKAMVFREFLPGGSPEKSGKMLDVCRALHAEENAILALSRAGVRLPDATVLYSTTFPCNLCANKIVTVGIKTVVYAEPYPMKEAEAVFRQQGVTLRRFEGVKSNAYFRMYA